MGNLEKISRKRFRSANLQKIVLHTIAAAGVLSVGLVAPNVLSAMDKMGLLPKLRQREYIASSASILRKKGLLRFKDGHYELTPAGEKVLRRWEMRNFKLNKPKKWDGKWRVVIFDIPQKKKKYRDHITMIFREAGFERLQNSVYVFPYDCEDVIGLLKTDLNLGKNILYMIVEELEDDKHLRQVFELL